MPMKMGGMEKPLYGCLSNARFPASSIVLPEPISICCDRHTVSVYSAFFEKPSESLRQNAPNKRRGGRTAKTVALAGSRHTLSQICIKLKHFDRRTLNAE
jgi:hypothetical protein